ncbi:hypothetical protein FQR65_LT03297 [Abscondita terminalis]|nr:hypothetical protein FQR65_LT03297 [Abscondita terminalis]
MNTIKNPTAVTVIVPPPRVKDKISIKPSPYLTPNFSNAKSFDKNPIKQKQRLQRVSFQELDKKQQEYPHQNFVEKKKQQEHDRRPKVPNQNIEKKQRQEQHDLGKRQQNALRQRQSISFQNVGNKSREDVKHQQISFQNIIQIQEPLQPEEEIEEKKRIFKMFMEQFDNVKN